MIERALVRWYEHARHARGLPWRKKGRHFAYRVWVSETMLQQTRIATVIPYFERFVRAFPTAASLAEAPLERVMSHWSGLGYYRRARLLHAGAQQVVRDHAGKLPDHPDALRRIAGVGAYTAGAIASIAYGRAVPVVDGNVARVLARLYAIEDDVSGGAGRRRVWDIATKLVQGAASAPGDWNEGLMELGETVCLPRAPRCDACPVARFCEGRARGIARELPRTAPKRAAPIVKRVAVVLASGGRVLVARRRAAGLFGGLWEAPAGDSAAPLARALGVDPGDLSDAGQVIHVLTHRRLHVRVLRGALPRGRAWEARAAEALAPDYDRVEVVDVGEATSPSRPHGALLRRVLAVVKQRPPGIGSTR